MSFIVATIFCLLCAGLLWRMAQARDVLDVQLGVIAAFSVGYFCLPIWFKNLSRLQFYNDDLIAKADLIFLLFAILVVTGVWLGRQSLPRLRGLSSPALDGYSARWRLPLSLLAFGWYMYYSANYNVTAYTASAEDFAAAFDGSGAASSVPAGLANLALAWLAYCVAVTLRDHIRGLFWAATTMLIICEGTLLSSGQRLAFLTPFVMVLAALAVTGQVRKAVTMLIVSVVALLLVSPLAVAVRQAPKTGTTNSGVGTFSYGASPVDTVFQSIIDRGDLVYVAVRMTPRIEADAPPGLVYYASVPLNIVPRAVYPGGAKPFLLSTNGEPSGELSFYAWRTIVGGDVGSLSAFGGLVAFRELGWAGVVLNGLATGLLFVVLYRSLGRGGVPFQVVYISLFVSLSVKKVPPSFWEALSEIVPMIPILTAALIGEFLLQRPGKRRSTSVFTTSSPEGRETWLP